MNKLEMCNNQSSYDDINKLSGFHIKMLRVYRFILGV